MNGKKAFEARKEGIFARDTGVLRNAASDAGASAAGNLARTLGAGSSSGWPQAVPDFEAPNDVRPKALDRRPVSLEADADAASAISLVFSCSNRGGERVGAESTTVRELAALIEWGTGNGRHVLELDIAEGTRVTLHTQTANVSILDYSVRPFPEAPYWHLEASASSSYLPGSKPAVKTQRVYRPNLFGTGGDGAPLPPLEVATRLARASAAATLSSPFVTEVLPRVVAASDEAVGFRVFGGRFAGITDLRLVGEGLELSATSVQLVHARELEFIARPARVGTYALEVDAVVGTPVGAMPQTLRFDDAIVVVDPMPLEGR